MVYDDVVVGKVRCENRMMKADETTQNLDMTNPDNEDIG